MKISTKLSLAAALGFLVMTPVAAFAYAPVPGPLPYSTTHRAIVPMGFSIFCLQNPDDCRSGGAPTVSSSHRVMSALYTVNIHVNHTMRPKADPPGVDIWTLGATAGDCDDYVLNKRQALIGRGIPSSALRIAYVKTRGGADHAVLVVKVGGRNLVLDNLTDRIVPLSRSGLRLVSMSGANPMQWS